MDKRVALCTFLLISIALADEISKNFQIISTEESFAALVNSQRNVLVLFTTDDHNEHDKEAFKTFKKAAKAFRDEQKTIGFVQASSSLFSELLHNNRLLLSNSQVGNSSFARRVLLKDLQFPNMMLFKARKVDRSCLLPARRSSTLIASLDNQEQAAIYKGTLSSVDNVVEFLNTNCDLDRDANGKISQKGMLKKELLSNLFSLKTVDDSKYMHDGELKCEKIEKPTREYFLKNYVMKSKPVIITGGMDNWKARTKWTNEYLKEGFGDNMVNIKVTPDGEFEGCEDITLWKGHEEPIPDVVKEQLQSPDKVVVRPADLRISFEKFLELLYSPNFNASFYLEYCSITSSLPTMLEDIETIDWANFFTVEMTNIWLGNGRTLGKLHFDPYDNLLCQVSGHKKLTLFEPHQNEELYEGHIREAEFDFSLETRQFSRNRLMDSTSMVMSPVDIKKPDLDAFPLFKNTKSINCTIGAGEILYLPAFWWHEVASVPDDFHRNIAVNYWYTPLFDKEFPCASCRLQFNRKYDHLLNTLNEGA